VDAAEREAGPADHPGSKAHAFVADLATPELDADDRHHLERVLRLRPGEEMTVSDGAGAWRSCRFGPRLELSGRVIQTDPPQPQLTIALAPTKADRPEWAVQKLTELGVDRIVVFMADRSVVRWDPDRAAGHLERLRRVAREAAMQSRRTYLPGVDGVMGFAEAAAIEGAALAERGGRPPTLDHPVVLVGPEGGWSGAELDAGLARVDLGPHVLRAETAALSAGAVLVAIRWGLVGQEPPAGPAAGG